VGAVKGREAERTIANAAVLDGDARVSELSRMLAGIGESAHARRHAAELLETAAATGASSPTTAKPAASTRRGKR
jgi:DNA repair protein RecN (Recombination protein N)